MLSNFDLTDMAEKEALDLIGVFSKNLMPEKRVCGSYIINLQDFEDGGGTHWVACKIFPNKQAVYFDAFGMPMPLDVNQFLNPFTPVGHSNRHIQDVKSEMCGFFCLAFIKYFNNFNYKKNDVFEAYDDFLNAFSNNYKTNDLIVMEMLNKY
jgi:hypothetical protein